MQCLRSSSTPLSRSRSDPTNAARLLVTAGQVRCQGAVRSLRSRSRTLCLAELQPAAAGKTDIGFVGVGIMGLAMARNLLKAGYSVTVWNRNDKKCEPLVEGGAKKAASPKDVAAQSDITFAMLSDPEAALAVASGPDGIVSGLSPGKGYVDVSTVDAATSQRVAAAVRDVGALFLEAPVSGSKGPAEQGTLIFLTAGDRELYDAVRGGPLDVMGKASFFLGDVGAGANMKLVVNMVMGTYMVALAEGIALAEKSGLDPSCLLEVVSLGAVATPMSGLKGPAMLSRRYPPAFPLKHAQKDMRLALALADGAAQPLAAAAAANDLYVRARAAGLGDSDFSAVMEAVAGQQGGAKQ